jgi:hypothetical protein
LQNTADILSVLNDHGFSDTSTNTKLSFLNDTISEFSALEPWPFLEASTTLTFDGLNAVATNLPADLRATVSVVDPGTGRIVVPERLDTLEKSGALMITQTGTDSLVYYFEAGQLRFAPIPTASFTARVRYLKFHPEVTADSVAANYLIPSRHWMVLVFGTLAKLYDLDDDPEMSDRMEGHFDKKVAKIRNELWKQQFDRPDHVVITDPDYLLDYPV